MDKKYQVFISSTFKDLHEERQKIISILLTADCIPAGMEAFVATDQEQFSVIKKVIDLCDYYILVLGNRYGSIDSNTGISYTEMEYNYAIEKGIPVLVFALDDEKRDQDEPEDKKVKLTAFKTKAMSNRLASMWKDSGDLQGKVALSIMHAKNEFNRPGWQRAKDYDELSLRQDIESLRSQLEATEKERDDYKKSLADYAAINTDLAFDNKETVTIPYVVYTPFEGARYTSAIFTWIELFKRISIEMANTSITEDYVYETLSSLVNDNTITDNVIAKVIMNQFEALKLIVTDYKNGQLLYSLTAKGKKLKNELNLIPKGTNI